MVVVAPLIFARLRSVVTRSPPPLPEQAVRKRPIASIAPRPLRLIALVIACYSLEEVDAFDRDRLTVSFRVVPGCVLSGPQIVGPVEREGIGTAAKAFG